MEGFITDVYYSLLDLSIIILQKFIHSFKFIDSFMGFIEWIDLNIDCFVDIIYIVNLWVPYYN